MTELNPLLLDLALILIVAGIVTIIFRALKQPVVLGYILAGVLTGPYISFIPTATEVSSVEFWGNIGVIFLLFSLGLEFSFKKMKSVGGPGAISVFAEVGIMFSMGFLVGSIFGWSTIASMFLGAMLSISSTSIIVKTFEFLGIGGKKSSQLTIGTLIFEDLAAILLMVILPTLVISKTFNGQELVSKIFYISIFLLLWFTGGIFFIPSLFKKFKRFLSGETLIVVSLGLCFVMVVITVKADISAALGAFVMGSILSGTLQKESILKLTKPIKDFFGAIFFVSVGMLVDPSVLIHYLPQILVITLTIIIAKPLAAIIGYLFSGQTLKIAIPAAVSLCQIGEFSYILATMGKNLNATPDYLYPIIVSVSILTTFITPYWVKMGDKLYSFIYSHSKESWRVVIDKLGTGNRNLNQQANWSILLKSYSSRVIIYSVWLFAVVIIMSTILFPFLKEIIGERYGDSLVFRVLMLIVTLSIMSPFMWALLKLKDKEGAFDRIWDDAKYARGPLLFMIGLKYFICIIAVSFVISAFITAPSGFVVLIIAAVLVTVVLSSRLKTYYKRIENTFLTNLNSEGGTGFIIPRDMASEMHMEKCEVEPNSFIAGKTIAEIHREKDTGALVIQIERGDLTIDPPPKEQILYPSDTLLLLGSDIQIKSFLMLAEADKSIQHDSDDSIEMKLFQISPQSHSPIIGQNANITNIRENFGVLIIGVEKDGSDDFLRPTSQVIIEPNDTIWVVGAKDKVLALKDQLVA